MSLPETAISVAELLENVSSQHSQNIALRYGSQSWDYMDLNEISTRLANGLWHLGIRPQMHVALWSDTTPNAVFLFYALQKIGAVAVLLNTCLKEEGLLKQLEMVNAEFLFIGDHWNQIEFDYQEVLKQFSQDCVLRILEEKNDKKGDFSKLIHLGGEVEYGVGNIDRESLALILFTSGTTTAQYRAVPILGGQLTFGAKQKIIDLDMDENDRVCSVIPMFHTFFININLMSTLAAGACLVLPKTRKMKIVLETLQESQSTMLSSVPSIYLALIGQKDFENYDLKSLRTGIIGGASCTYDQFCHIEDSLKFTLLPALGQTEVVAGITIASLMDPIEVRATTVGHFIPYLEWKIKKINPTEKDDVVGEILLRGPTVINKYYTKGLPLEYDDKTWLHTGDLGWCDDKGNLHLSGRIKDIIIRGGENIVPKELEVFLSQDPRVLKCKAIPIPDMHYGEEICMCVVCKSGVNMIPDEVKELMRVKFATYQIPKWVFFFEEFPYNHTGKIAKRELIQLAKEEISKTYKKTKSCTENS